MRRALFSLPLLLGLCATVAQAARQEFTDPVALLQAVARNYAAGADTFRIESITETAENNELHREWRKVYQSALKGPGARYRIETRSPFGSYIQDSDGKNEWVYLVEAKVYVERPLPQNWPDFSGMAGGMFELRSAWEARTFLEADAAGYKHAVMQPAETLTIEGRSYPCYVIYATSNDGRPIKDYHWKRTLWIDKSALVIRKEFEQSDTVMMFSSAIHIPLRQEKTTVYPVVDFNPQTTPEMFQFTPPQEAKLVGNFTPGVSPPSKPMPTMLGDMAPDVSFPAPDGRTIELSSFRGKPLLIDFWATWCGSCLVSMPSLGRIYADAKDKGLTVITFDQETVPEDAPAYLARHGYSWANYHDTDAKIRKAFQDDGIPLAVLIDAKGKIVFYNVGADDASLRKAIASLGPEFSTFADSGVSAINPGSGALKPGSGAAPPR